MTHSLSLEQLVSLAAAKTKAVRSIPPAVSVVVPIFNHADFFPQCLASILEQQTGQLELVCIDDCSADPRIGEILGRLDGFPGIVCLRNENNLGISESQNLAVARAQGRYVAFVDCDDFLMPGALDRVLAIAAQHENPDYLFSDRRNVDVDGKKLFDAVYQVVQSGRGVIADLTDRMIASHLKVIRRDSFLKAHGFGQTYSGIQDWELALKISRFGRFHYLPEVLYCHRHHQASVTHSDSRGQARRSNMLRRAHIDECLSALPIPTGESAGGGGPSRFSVKKLAGQGWYCPESVSMAIREGKSLHLDATGELSPGELEFVVDFNSYFDRIDIDRIDVASQIVGSLWSPAILHSPLHCAESWEKQHLRASGKIA